MTTGSTALIAENKALKARVCALEAALVRICKLSWSLAIDTRNEAQQKAEDMEWTVEEMQKAGMDAWLPELEEARGIFNASEGTLAEIGARRDKRLIEAVLKGNEYSDKTD